MTPTNPPRRRAFVRRLLDAPLLPLLALLAVFLACDEAVTPPPEGAQRQVVIRPVTAGGTDLVNVVGIQVRVDGQGVALRTVDGHTGYVANLAPGDHALVVESNGYTPVNATLTVADDAPSLYDHFVTMTGPTDVDGRVVDAQTGAGVAGAQITFYRQATVDSSPAANPEIELTTDAEGGFHVENAPSGFFSVFVYKDEYAQVRLSGIEITGGTFALPPLAMTTLPAAGTYRAVLTWAEQSANVPADLDAHLTHRDPAGNVTYHVYYANPSAGGTSLDRDDTSYGGPETVTIDLTADGTYRFSVYNYSDPTATGAAGMLNGNAVVQLYSSAGLIYSYSARRDFPIPVPAGNTWRAFQMIKVGNMITATPGGTFLGIYTASGSNDGTVFLDGGEDAPAPEKQAAM